MLRFDDNITPVGLGGGIRPGASRVWLSSGFTEDWGEDWLTNDPTSTNLHQPATTCNNQLNAVGRCQLTKTQLHHQCKILHV